MIIPEEILAQIREIKDIFKNLNQSLLLDTFIYDENEYNTMSKAHNPYGDGKACERIVNFIKETNI